MAKKNARRKPKPEPTPEAPVNTCAQSMFNPTIERPQDSDAVRVTKELEDLQRQIESHRTIMSSLLREYGEYKDRLHTALMNHTELQQRLTTALAVPKVLG